MAGRFEGLIVRVLTAAVGVPFVILTCIYFPLIFKIAVTAIIIIGSLEFYGLVGRGSARPMTFWGTFLAACLSLGAYWGNGEDICLLLALFTALLIFIQMTKGERDALAGAGATLLGIVYVGWLFSHVILLRGIPTCGAGYVLLLFVALWLGDSTAYFIGTAWGRHKLAPSISPNKSWEGAVGGMVFAVIGLLVAKELQMLAQGRGIMLLPDVSRAHYVSMAIIISVSGQIGDLCESYLKRDADVKDAGFILPGHGGVLDRFDSLLFAAPALYYYARLVLKT